MARPIRYNTNHLRNIFCRNKMAWMECARCISGNYGSDTRMRRMQRVTHTHALNSETSESNKLLPCILYCIKIFDIYMRLKNFFLSLQLTPPPLLPVHTHTHTHTHTPPPPPPSPPPQSSRHAPEFSPSYSALAVGTEIPISSLPNKTMLMVMMTLPIDIS